MIDVKICSSCKVEKPISQFGKNKSRADGYQHLCFECRRIYSSQYYKNVRSHQLRIKDSNIRRKQEIKKFIIEYLQTHPCVDCSIKDVRVLEFDHIRDKKFNIGDMIAQVHSLSSIKEEIEKCEIRCANCHRIKTLSNNNSYRNVVGE